MLTVRWLMSIILFQKVNYFKFDTFLLNVWPDYFLPLHLTDMPLFSEFYGSSSVIFRYCINVFFSVTKNVLASIYDNDWKLSVPLLIVKMFNKSNHWMTMSMTSMYLLFETFLHLNHTKMYMQLCGFKSCRIIRWRERYESCEREWWWNVSN